MARTNGKSSLETGRSGVASKIFKELKTIPESMWWRYVGSPMQKRGMPDIQGIIAGHFIAIEVKAPGGQPTNLQLIVLRDLELAGATVGIAESVEEAMEIVADAMRYIEQRRTTFTQKSQETDF